MYEEVVGGSVAAESTKSMTSTVSQVVQVATKSASSSSAEPVQDSKQAKPVMLKKKLPLHNPSEMYEKVGGGSVAAESTKAMTSTVSQAVQKNDIFKSGINAITGEPQKESASTELFCSSIAKQLYEMPNKVRAILMGKIQLLIAEHE